MVMKSFRAPRYMSVLVSCWSNISLKNRYTAVYLNHPLFNVTRGYKIGGRSWVSQGTPPSPLLKGGGKWGCRRYEYLAHALRKVALIYI